MPTKHIRLKDGAWGPKGLVLIDMMARDFTIAETANLAKVGLGTIHKWQRDPEFQEAVLKRKEELLLEDDAAVDPKIYKPLAERNTLVGTHEEAEDLINVAVSTLRDICTNNEATDANRISAAAHLLRAAAHYQDRARLEAQLIEIERRAYAVFGESQNL